jgi:DNA polymerase I-like protein with 3'-5' exonuclease and polymerase domains
VNSPVQGFASDLMQIAAASIAGLLPGYARVPDCHIVATVHDSILVEVPIRGWEHAVAQCRDRMLNVDDVLVRLGCALDVPLAVSVKVGTRWGVGDVAEL